jgi:hypothetical protein
VSDNDLIFAIFVAFVGLIAFCVLVANIRIALVQRAQAKYHYTPPREPSNTD